VSALNETHNIDFTTEKENRKMNSRKRKTAVPSEKINKTKSLQNTRHTYRTFKRNTPVPEQKIAPLRSTGRLKSFFLLIRAGNT